MSACSLYILKDKAAPLVKIGIAGNVTRRGAILPQEIDWGHSVYFEYPTRDIAYRGEQLLHAMLTDVHHLHRQQPGEGGTEWFDATAKELAIEFLTSTQTAMGGTGPHVRPIVLRRGVAPEKRDAWLAKRKATLHQATANSRARGRPNLVRLAEFLTEYLSTGGVMYRTDHCLVEVLYDQHLMGRIRTSTPFSDMGFYGLNEHDWHLYADVAPHGWPSSWLKPPTHPTWRGGCLQSISREIVPGLIAGKEGPEVAVPPEFKGLLTQLPPAPTAILNTLPRWALAD